ncbi:unnamed protein product [Zymoseptoria tritici ST99CH_1A5]|uniref:Extracellular membrane protein CFEM domain-containing protein n=2 Tax=Zymoseptoria tritici TaxID=1047171 RepID=A0A1X7RJW5_ZYMT9|nr:unnamed protein product [Zymoseptoria tritici ST99CH_3D7]SMR47284.1 unnamed protein product [Zymoseptoria tritici ST99CH_3D1]SMY21180.1 unnamed protein product [Zymoseptoria tritici ST99CH_1A5]
MQLTKYLLLATTMSTAVSARIGVTQNCVGPPGYEAVSMCKKAGGTQTNVQGDDFGCCLPAQLKAVQTYRQLCKSAHGSEPHPFTPTYCRLG